MQTEFLVKSEPCMLEIFGMSLKHKKFDRNLFETVLRQEREKVLNLATRESRKLYKMHREVCASLHLKKGFLRFELSKSGIIYTKTNIEHNIEYDLMHFFHNRFPFFYIIIESNNKSYTADKTGVVKVTKETCKEVVNRLESTLPEHELLSELEFEEEIWETYYDSQFIKERRNMKLMQKMMPLKHRDSGMIETNISKRSKKLTDFMK